MKYVFLLFSFLCLSAPLFSAEAEAPKATYNEKLAHGGEIKISWEKSGQAAIDAQSEILVQEVMGEFKKNIEEFDEDTPEDGYTPPEYTLSLEGMLSGTPGVTAMLWSVYEYLGGAHGSLWRVARLYDAKTGETVEPFALFARPDTAENIMSEVARRELLAQGLDWDFVEPGTVVGEGNFRTLIPDAEGVTLYFDPYQVAPGSEGPREVHVSFTELAPAQPIMRYWKP